MKHKDDDIKFCNQILGKYHFTDDDRIKLASILQRFLLYKGIRERQKRSGVIP